MNESSLFDALSFAVVAAMFLGPPVAFGFLYWLDRRQSQHAVLRNFPLLGRLRYLFEKIGPELRQYLFDGDREGRPFSRTQYVGIVKAGKYCQTLIAFGSKRDFEAPGWYVRNALFPVRREEMAVVLEPRIGTERYEIADEGLFARKEKRVPGSVAPWISAAG